jgi:DNA-directed RNA polymerase I subunit RPA2
VRKLLPESFGFMCPVHTPDGSPCGLLNHLTHRCNVVAKNVPEGSTGAVLKLLASSGLVPASTCGAVPRLPQFVSVHLDGCVVGYLAAERAPEVVMMLRQAKAEALKAEGRGLGVSTAGSAVPYHTELCYLPFERRGPYPGLIIQTQQARVARPLRQVESRAIEFIGSLEQLTMHIRCECLTDWPFGMHELELLVSVVRLECAAAEGVWMMM